MQPMQLRKMQADAGLGYLCQGIEDDRERFFDPAMAQQNILKHRRRKRAFELVAR
jgi:hypothetical protein